MRLGGHYKAQHSPAFSRTPGTKLSTSCLLRAEPIACRPQPCIAASPSAIFCPSHGSSAHGPLPPSFSLQAFPTVHSVWKALLQFSTEELLLPSKPSSSITTLRKSSLILGRAPAPHAY